MSNVIDTPRFIVVDGIDGVGKSLLVNNIQLYLANKKYDSQIVHVVESTPLAANVKAILKSTEVIGLSATTLGLLFSAAISDVIEKVIQPAQQKGQIIISDRYTMSTRVYQSDSDYIEKICDIIDSLMTPDITFVLDAPPEIIQARVGVRGSDGDVTESICDEEINKRRMSYAKLANLSNKDTYIIDASGTPEDVLQRVKEILDTYY